MEWHEEIFYFVCSYVINLQISSRSSFEFGDLSLLSEQHNAQLIGDKMRP